MSNINTSSANSKVYFLEAGNGGPQLLAEVRLSVTAGTTAALTLPAGPDVVITEARVINESVITGDNTVQILAGAAALSAAVDHLNTINTVTQVPCTAATAVVLKPGVALNITQATGTAGTIVVQLFGCVKGI